MDMNHDDAVALAGQLQGTAMAKPALLLDFDGTLTDIAPAPDAVTIAPDLVDALQKLHGRLGGALALVSGRSIDMLDHFLAPLMLDAAGLHGSELRLGHDVTRLSPAAGLTEARRHTTRRVAQMGEGVLLEDKGLTLALHWRRDRARETDALLLMTEALAIAGDGWRLQRGACVAELLPATADKGIAVQKLMAAAPFSGRKPIYCGDDLTDEAAFMTAQELGGIGVKIGNGQTAARLRLPDPTALRNVLAVAVSGD
jgi:trehalose 6-phosphate phosphatase